MGVSRAAITIRIQSRSQTFCDCQQSCWQDVKVRFHLLLFQGGDGKASVRKVDVSRANCLTKYVEIKCQLDATEVFIADLIACSTCFVHHYAHHQELKSIIQWLLPVVFRAVVFK